MVIEETVWLFSEEYNIHSPIPFPLAPSSHAVSNLPSIVRLGVYENFPWDARDDEDVTDENSGGNGTGITSGEGETIGDSLTSGVGVTSGVVSRDGKGDSWIISLFFPSLSVFFEAKYLLYISIIGALSTSGVK